MSETASAKAYKRYAVYCRVPSNERLGQEFNPIDTQKEAGCAHITSQQSEGRIPVADDYDDSGFSGGNTERPGLRRPMTDTERGQIDIVVVYKIDHLTHSLAGFSKMVKVFERHRMFFVSATRQFSTTASMSRLMPNVPLSFAQFECGVTSEHIRDKIVAAKRRGMRMDGVPPLGYDVGNRLLTISGVEATVVCRTFEEMLTIGSPTQIAINLTVDGITTEVWTTQGGQAHSGTRIDKKYLYELLRNRIYLGELSHKGNWYPDTHPPTIELKLWDKVHTVLARDEHAQSVEVKIRSHTDILLRGLLYAPLGERMYPTYSCKSGRKYRYYVFKSES